MASAKASVFAGLTGGRGRELAIRVLRFVRHLTGRQLRSARGPIVSASHGLGVSWLPIGLVWWRAASRELARAVVDAARVEPAPPAGAPGRLAPPAPPRAVGSIGRRFLDTALAEAARRAPATGRPVEERRPEAGASVDHAPRAPRSPGGAAAVAGAPTQTAASPPVRPGDRTVEAGAERAGDARPSGRTDAGARLHVPHALVHGPFNWLTEARRRARIHLGAEGDRRARAVGARAVTIGRDVFFRAGAFEPETPRGAALMAHELTHVWQHARRDVRFEAREAGRLEGGLEREASAVERSVRATGGAAEAGRERAGAATASVAPVALHFAVARSMSEPRPAAGVRAPVAAAAGRVGGTALALRAPDDAGAGSAPGEGGASDPGEVAAHVFRLLERRLRIDRERAGVGRA